MIPAYIKKDLLPHKPGVYLFRNRSRKILYVGKAIDLYHRVASYFSGRPDSPKTAALIQEIAHCETIVVASELEALILEANLIKKHLPPYNIKLTDDKDYLYIKITKEFYPKILTARKSELGDAKEYFGPFPSSRVVRSTLKKLRRTFPWCSNPPRFLGHEVTGKQAFRACFHYHLGLCPGACTGRISQKEYLLNIRRFSQFMRGNKTELIAELNREMEKAAKKLQFENAQQLKRIISNLEYLTQSNSAEAYLENPNFLENQNQLSLKELKRVLNLENLPHRIEGFDISNLQGDQAVGSLVVLSEGDIDKKWYRKFKIKISGNPNDVAMIREVISRRLKHPEWPLPDLIIVDGGRGQLRAAEEEVKKAGFNIPVFGLAKRREWLYGSDHQTLKMPPASLALRALQKIRDEAHRFALNYHRKLRAVNSWYDI